MNYYLAASAAAAACLFGANVLAQSASSVTVFGIADVNVRSIRNGPTRVNQVASDGMHSSRLGFRGTEDLGAGLSAAFWLESAVTFDTGVANAKFWNRRSTVSLLSRSLGEVRLGRDFDPTFLNITGFDPFATTGIGATTNVISVLGSGAATLLRTDNGVSYFLPSGLGGVYGQVHVAAGEGVPGNKYTGGRLGYAAGPVDVAIGMAQTWIATADHYKLINAALSWSFGSIKLLGQANRGEYGARRQTHWMLGTVASFGASDVRASYSSANASGGGTGANDANQLAVGYYYNLSKRTTLYSTLARIDNKGASNFAVATTPAAVAGQKSTGVQLGMRHGF